MGDGGSGELPLACTVVWYSPLSCHFLPAPCISGITHMILVSGILLLRLLKLLWTALCFGKEIWGQAAISYRVARMGTSWSTCLLAIAFLPNLEKWSLTLSLLLLSKEDLWTSWISHRTLKSSIHAEFNICSLWIIFVNQKPSNLSLFLLSMYFFLDPLYLTVVRI